MSCRGVVIVDESHNLRTTNARNKDAPFTEVHMGAWARGCMGALVHGSMGSWAHDRGRCEARGAQGA